MCPDCEVLVANPRVHLAHPAYPARLGVLDAHGRARCPECLTLWRSFCGRPFEVVEVLESVLPLRLRKPLARVRRNKKAKRA